MDDPRTRLLIAASAGVGVGFASGPPIACAILPHLPDVIERVWPWRPYQIVLAAWVWSCLSGGAGAAGISFWRLRRRQRLDLTGREDPGVRTPARPRLRKTRWCAVLLPWLLGAYWPLSGPCTYAMVRGWLPVPAHRALHAPLMRLRGRASEENSAYQQWWLDLAYEHELERR